MAEPFVAAVLLVSFTVLAAMEAARRRIVRRPPPPAGGALPAVSVLKPLRGADPSLEANLDSVFRQDHPDFEVLLGAADADDPALEVARRVAARHPHVRSRVVADRRRVGPNPKVDNLANLLRRARHELVLVSDSNVAVPPAYLRELVGRHGEGVGLVTSLFRGVPGGTLGSRLEALQLDTFVAGGIALASAAGHVCVVGKSMLLARRDLGRIGGMRALGRYLAEDQVCGEEMAAAGLRIVVASTVIENRLGDLALRDAAARHLRWARIRRAMNPLAYAGELLLCPVALSLAAAAVLRTPASVALVATAALGRAVLDAAATAGLGGHVTPLHPLLAVLRDVGVAALWPLAWFGRTVTWRGNVLRIGGRTLLEPVTTASGDAQVAPRPSFAGR